MRNLFSIFGLALALSACSSKMQVADGNGTRIDRAPATQDPPVPWVPGMPPPGHATRRPQNQNPEAAAGCQLPLNNVLITKNSSAARLLLALRSNASLTGTYEGDAKALSPWFGDTSPGRDIYEMSKGSEAFRVAIEFVKGPMIRCTQDGRVCDTKEFVRGHKFAMALVALMALQTDSECVKVAIQIAKEGLGANFALIEQLPFLAAIEHVKVGQIEAKFKEVDGNKEKIDKEITKLEAELAVKERQNEIELRRLSSDLQARYRELKVLFAQIPQCREVIAFAEMALTDDQTPSEHVRNMQSECAKVINDRLNKLAEEEARLVSLNVAKGENPERTKKLEEAQKKAKNYRGFLEILNDKDVLKSIESKILEIEALVQTKKTKKESLTNSPERTQLIDARKRMYSLSPNWLTYGYFGGYLKNR